jgi:hypothetical protein
MICCRAPIKVRQDNLDHHGKIARRLDDKFVVDPTVGAETQGAVKDGRAGQARIPRRLDDGAIKRMSLGPIGLTDERAKKDGLLR